MTLTSEFSALSVDGQRVHGGVEDIRTFGVNLTQTPAQRRTAFQAAIDAVDGVAALRVPTGIWDVQGVDGEVLTLRSDTRIVGDGPTSVVRVSSGSVVPGGVILFGATTVNRIQLSNLTLDGNRTNLVTPGEQSHNVQLYKTRNVHLERVRSINSHGDAFRVLGEPGLLAYDTFIDRCVVENPNRSGVAIQRGVVDLRIIGCSFTDVQDTPIDFELSGTPENEGIEIAHCWIDQRTAPGGAGISMSGISPSLPGLKTRVHNNWILGGIIESARSRNSEINSNWIEPKSGYRAIELSGIQEDVFVHHNRIITIGGFQSIYLYARNNGAERAARVTIAHNDISTDKDGIRVEDVTQISLVGNIITRSGGANTSGIVLAAQVAAGGCADVEIYRNRIYGAFEFGIFAGALASNIAGLDVSENLFNGNMVGVEYDKTSGSFTGTRRHSGNRFVACTTNLNGLADVEPLQVGGDDALPILHGTLDPTAGGGVVAPLGAAYHRSDGTVYRKSGAGATAWTAM